jgi:hypothetical protein
MDDVFYRAAWLYIKLDIELARLGLARLGSVWLGRITSWLGSARYT